MQKEITIIIRVDDVEKGLNLRYLLADSLASRKIGEVINEGTGEGFMDITIVSDYSLNLERQIYDLLRNMGVEGEVIIEDID